MRKYQQLCLLVLSCICVIVLIIYKSENNRLKYVLQVVNFFGRKDAEFLAQFQNITNDYADFDYPLPVWQSIDNTFYAYGTYWTIIADGEGEALAEVVGKRESNLQYRCYINFEDGSRNEGKFRFQRLHDHMDNVDIINYNFFCYLKSSAISAAESVLFTSGNNMFKKPLRLRKLASKTNTYETTATVCLDLVSADAHHKRFYRNKNNMLQFFLHYKTLGIEHFLIYNSDALSSGLIKVLRQAQIRLHLMPFNFPFAITQQYAERLRELIKINCVRRTSLSANYTLIVSPNEFLYTEHRFTSSHSALKIADKTNLTHLYVHKVDICLNAQKPLLIDSSAYDESKLSAKNHIVIYNLRAPNVLDTTSISEKHGKQLASNVIFVHAYVECVHIGTDGLNDWHNKLNKDFKRDLLEERSELAMFIK